MMLVTPKSMTKVRRSSNALSRKRRAKGSLSTLLSMKAGVAPTLAGAVEWCLSLHLGGAVRSGITLSQLGSDGFNTFFDLFCSAFEVSRSGFNDEILNTEVGCKFLLLETFFGVVCGKQLFDKSATAFADIQKGIAFISDDWRPSNMLCLESNGFARCDAADHPECIERYIFF